MTVILTRKQLGAAGEQHAEAFLKKQGYTILARNWRCRSGEIDIIALEGELVVFVEVRTRTSSARFGTPEESIDARKQHQVIATSQVYLHQNQLHDHQVRFDTISVYADQHGALKHLDHIRCAF
jgi:putative endonuclease